MHQWPACLPAEPFVQLGQLTAEAQRRHPGELFVVHRIEDLVAELQR
jgi:hypothetical protein